MAENEQRKEHIDKLSQIGIKVLIINPRDEVLLLRRNPDAYGDGKSYWDIPGGRVEKDIDVATIINGGGGIHPELRRELQEEIGWSPEDSNTLTFVSHQQIKTSSNADVDRYTVALRINEDISVRLSPEHTEYKWVPASMLGNTPDLGGALKSLVTENKISR